MIIVTGASRGIGFAIAERLHSLNLDVIGISRKRFKSSFDNFQVDVSKYDEVRNFALKLKNEKIFPQVLVNAAGIASMNLALMTTPQKSSEIIDVNLLGTIFMCQNFVPLIARNGNGTIINFSSIAVTLGLRGEAIYAASKAGVESYTRILAREISELNIRANCIAPGPIKTELLNGITEFQINEIIKQQVISRQFTVQDVCDLVEILLDKRFSSVSGEVIHLGGV